jgi:hypothetical protein
MTTYSCNYSLKGYQPLLGTMERIKVLYIAGFERSGSTIVNRIFGQIDDFVAWGELRDVWEHAILENRLCSCGVPFHNCETWQAILKQGFGSIDQIDAPRLIASLRQAKKYIALNQVLPVPVSPSPAVKLYLEYLTKFYSAIQSVTNCRVIVDSTKASWYGAALNQIPELDVYTLHLLRDPRGVCQSLQRRKLEGEPECQWYNPVHASLSWMLKNAAVESFLKSSEDRYLQMKFEDFVSQPQQALAAVFKMIGEESADLSCLQGESVYMKTDHIFTGSPSSRSTVGTVKLKVDERWKREMTDLDKIIIGNITWSLRKKYQYS